MKRNYHRIISFFTTFCITFFMVIGFGPVLHAQDVKEDLAHINQVYDALKEGEVTLEYRRYAGSEPDKPEIVTGFSRWQGNQHFMQTGEMEKLQNKTYTVLVNHQMKSVIIQPAVDASPFVSPVPLDSILGLCQSVQYLSKEKGLHAYRFEIAQVGFEAIEIVFHPKTYLIHRIVCYQFPWKEGEPADRMEVHYQNMKKLRQRPSFSEQKYVRKEGDQFVLQAAYKGYELYNFCR